MTSDVLDILQPKNSEIHVYIIYIGFKINDCMYLSPRLLNNIIVGPIQATTKLNTEWIVNRQRYSPTSV